jgi:hypothetical protein
MQLSIWFWVIYVLSLLFSVWGNWPAAPGPAGFRPLGSWMLFYVLVGILGYAQFGSAVHR